jgi:addiction module RelE/StbE family toxin
MIQIIYHRNFKKSFRKLKKTDQEAVKERLKIFILDQNHSLLNNHALHGKFYGCRSINVTGDLRLIYEEVNNGLVLLHEVDNHSNLYR